MKKTLLFALSMAVAGASLSTLPLTADAKRLGGGRPAGMQRQMPAKPASPPTNATPNSPQQAAPAQAPAAPAAPAAAPGKRSWLGPIAGLAAGLGLAALMSHLGLGAAFGNIITMLLLAVVAFVAIRWAMRRFGSGAARTAQPMGFGGPQMAGAGAGAAAAPAWANNAATPLNAPLARTSQTSDVALPPLQPVLRTPESLGSVSQFGPDTSHHAAQQLPPGVDAAAFERLAKMVFIRLQAANDAGAVDDLRKFTTPELFASLRLDLQERGKLAQQTDVVELDAQLVEAVQEDGQWIASVRFRGLIREEAGAEATPFDELWHLVKPLDDSRPDAQQWAIAGITPQG